MNEFDIQELQLIIFLCIERKSIIGLDESEREEAADLYRHACALIRNYNETQ